MPKRGRDKNELVCEHCGRVFYAVKKSARFHNGACQRAAHRDKEMAVVMAELAAVRKNLQPEAAKPARVRPKGK